MEGGGRGSDGGVGSNSSLTWACHCPCLFMRAGCRLQAVVSCAVVFVPVCSFPFVGMCRCLVSWCTVGRLVDPRGCSWSSHVVAGGVSFVIVGHVTWASLLMLEKEVGVWGYGTHLHAQ